MSKVTPISGFPEYLPSDRIVEQQFLDVIRQTFELHGFASIETRAVEPIDRLSNQGEDADKEIYAVRRLGAPAEEKSDLGLHFDLTVPFARYVLEHAGKLAFPFRRYQIQKVWRGERPQEGRYREFTQADIDIVGDGTLPFHYEVELPLVIADAFSKLPIPPFRIQVNNRQIPEGFYRGLGIEDVTSVLRIVDKLDKIGPDKITQLLTADDGPALKAETAKQVLRLAEISSTDASFVEQVRALGVQHEILDEGLERLAAIMTAANEHAPGLLVADLKIARGLDYYTGTVYETQLIGHESYGSICSGGRYDSLASDGKTTYPGVGISIGVSRLIARLFSQGLVKGSRSTPTAVLVALNNEDERADAMRTAATLRARNIPVEVAPAAAKFGKQIKFADRRGIPFVWFTTENGAEVKDIRSGDQVPADPATWAPPAQDVRPSIETPQENS